MTDQSAKTLFATNVEACVDSLYGLALRLTGNRVDAEDLVADSVAKAWSSIATVEDSKRFRPWLFRILHNCFISDYRKKSARPIEYGFDELSASDEECDLSLYMASQSGEYLQWWGNPEREFANQLLCEEITAALDALPEAFRITVLLVNVEGLSYDETAEVLGIPPGTVRSRMKRGRTLLQKALWHHAKDAGLVSEDHTTGQVI
jgi:RNA polymerase sigma-70 factor (ECF subfamily)